jgi:hypothetical protein
MVSGCPGDGSLTLCESAGLTGTGQCLGTEALSQRVEPAIPFRRLRKTSLVYVHSRPLPKGVAIGLSVATQKDLFDL